jgi:hypothetical protein
MYVLFLGLAEGSNLLGRQRRQRAGEGLDVVIVGEEVGALFIGFAEELQHLRLNHGFRHP